MSVKINDKTLSGRESHNFFSMKKENIKKLGIRNYTVGRFKKLKDIFEKDTGMVIGQCTKGFITNNNDPKRRIEFKKGESYVMPFNVYSQFYKSDKLFKPYRKPFNDYFKRYRGQDLTNKTLFIWRTGGIGDIIVAQSVVKAIKEKYPTCRIIFATAPQNIEVFYSWPLGLVDEVTTVPFRKEILEKSNYHLTFIHSIENCDETHSYNYFDIFKKVSGLDYNVDDYLSELKPLKNIDDKVKPLIPNNVILLHMSSTTKLRFMDPSIWIQTAKKLIELGYYVGFIDSKNNADKIDSFIGQLNIDHSRVLNLARISFDINHAIAIFNNCVGGICIDSSLAHVAGALRKPAVCICGPYPGYNVVGPYPTVIGVNADKDWNECGKYPCYYNSQEHLCPYLMAQKPPGCQSSIKSDTIVETLIDLINTNKKGI